VVGGVAGVPMQLSRSAELVFCAVSHELRRSLMLCQECSRKWNSCWSLLRLVVTTMVHMHTPC
jgi:hypothetical protein